MVEALDALRARSFLLAVCTNKYEGQAVRLLGLLGIADRFATICGRETFPYFKPDPRHITLTVERAGGDPARAVMVGDSRADIDAAKAAGIPVVAVPFGYTDLPVNRNRALYANYARVGTFAAGGLVGYDFGAFKAQLMVTRTVADRGVGAFADETRGWFRIIAPLYTAAAPAAVTQAPLVRKY